ncbi:MAG: hypothetical protein Q4A27_00970 [bacterium]|nr:hypothetical protein [bacterium]
MNSKRQNLNQIIRKSHAVIIEVPCGFGFDFAKKQIDFLPSDEILDVFPQVHDGQKTEIFNVEDIENLQSKLSAKNQREQFLIFHNAGKMNEQAQNKFLKILEEPRANLHFILLSNSADDFLLTVRSRAQRAKIEPISEFESIQLLKKNKVDETKMRQILFLANGLPGEIERLSTDKKYAKGKFEIAEMAKKWCVGNKMEKMVIVNNLRTNRENALEMLSQVLNILRRTANEKTLRNNAFEMRKILQAYRNIEKNGNIRLALLEIIF